MTRDEILNMPAGREMDALVAEKVMGWINVEKTTWSNFRADGTRFGGGEELRGTPPNHYDINPVMYPVKNYSTDIAAAWQVVEKMQAAHEWYFHFGNKLYIFNIVDDNGEPEEDHRITLVAHNTSHTAPLAICRAALLAVMEEK